MTGPDSSSHLQLDAGLDAFLAALTAGAYSAPDGVVDLEDMRAAADRTRMAFNIGGPKNLATRDLTAETRWGPVPIRIHWPATGARPGTLVFLHGGGWTLFGLDSHDRLMRTLAAESGWTVAGVDYPRAPETPFPGPLDACWAVLEWVRNSGLQHGLKPPIVVGGDSAGANLALSTALVRPHARTLADGLLLFYGVYDCDNSRNSYTRFGDQRFPLTAERMEWFWRNYCPDPRERHNPLASPLRANLEGLPPCYLVIAGQDILADENKSLAQKLRASQVSVTVAWYPGAIHAFAEALAFSAVSRRAVADAATWLRTCVPFEAGRPAQ
jgi:acetyl esterase